MMQVLIGHRGVGKSSLLKRLKAYFPDTTVTDLDSEIESLTGQTVSQIFQSQGEAKFRDLEVRTLENIKINGKTSVVALGAGFPLDRLPQDVEVIWVRRSTDSIGRVFTDRPRLNSMVTPFSEYMERFPQREKGYRRAAHWDYLMPEGHFQLSTIEENIFAKKSRFSDIMMTLPTDFKRHLEFVLQLDFEKLELRDDLLSEKDIEDLIQKVPAEKLLISFRRPNKSVEFLNRILPLIKDIDWDWAIENHSLSAGAKIISMHERKAGESLQEALRRLQESATPSQHLKLAVEIFDFKELGEGLVWQAAEPLRRSFLPRSKEGRWSWVRCYLKGRQRIGFLKFFEGSAGDQPSPFEWLSTPPKPQRFAAVLGSPVFHSRSPAFHRDFFSSQAIPFWAIDISEAEWPQAYPLLRQLGLCAAAVTSPLKMVAGGVNTLWKHNTFWRQANTDGDGLRFLLKGIETKVDDQPFIWGGGGTLAVIQEIFPRARLFSVRSGLERTQGNQDLPEWVIWAAPPRAQEPPSNWQPKLVVDLNYREDSAAKEFALRVGAQYVSGAVMFEAQALQQQTFWKEILNER
jgi:shikimate kinase